MAHVEPDFQVGSSVVPVPGLVHGPRTVQIRRWGDEPNDPLGGSRVSPEVNGALARLQGRGRPLPANIADAMGEAMGADLGEVRIHTGDEPAALARSVQATAFTLGRDIYFGAGSYAPQTTSGQRLLAHELAHTVQQGPAGRPGGGPVIGRAGDPAEHEADRVADGVLGVLRRRSSEVSNPDQRAGGLTASPALMRSTAPSRTAAPSPTRLLRKVGFEAELMVPSLGPSADKLKYLKSAADVTDSVKSFLDGGVPYGTDMGGHAGGLDVRLDSDHGGSIDRGPIVQKLADLGFVSGTPHEPRTKIEFVTTAMDELAPGANKRLRTVGESLKQLLSDALTQAKSGKMHQLGAPAKAGFKTGVPVEDFDTWWWLDKESTELDEMIQDYLKNGIQDEIYLQATVGVVPSALLAFFAQAALPGRKVEVAPPSEARKHILGIVQEVVAELDTTFNRAPADHWITTLDKDSRDAFLGLIGLIYSYLLGDTLQQTSGGTTATVKNAVPFLIKTSPHRLLAKTATQTLKNDPPPQEFVRNIGDRLKKTKYLQLAYWVEQARGDEPSAVGEGKLAAKLEARPTEKRLITGDYTDFTERVLLGTGGAISVVIGKELPAPDKPTINSGDINVFYELYNQNGIPLEYRAISKRYTVSELLPAINQIIGDVRKASMSGLTDEQKAKVKEAYESDV
ncbi:eCIS core domain-containing protein [Nakamurella sp. GG22]